MRYQIYDPLTVKPDPQRPGFFIRDPFPGNIIPQNRIINPMYQHYVDFLPKPNSNPVDPRQEPTNNYLVRTYTDPIQSQIYGARLDYNHSSTHRFLAAGVEATSPKVSTTGPMKAWGSTPKT